MSRIGKKPILIPEKVDVKIDGNLVIVKGAKGELMRNIHNLVKIAVKDKEIILGVKNEDDKFEKSLWGTERQMINNMIVGVSEGFSKQLEISGVGYRVAVSNKNLTLSVGFSHPVEFKVPDNIDVSVEKNLITISGIDKQQVGEISAQIRKVRKPEPYKGKGIKYVGESIIRKAGKQAKSSKA
ncbi:MAG: 50S ribosomal protein L6 [Patescibacteria group bacterium]